MHNAETMASQRSPSSGNSAYCRGADGPTKPKHAHQQMPHACGQPGTNPAGFAIAPTSEPKTQSRQHRLLLCPLVTSFVLRRLENHSPTRLSSRALLLSYPYSAPTPATHTSSEITLWSPAMVIALQSVNHQVLHPTPASLSGRGPGDGGTLTKLMFMQLPQRELPRYALVCLACFFHLPRPPASLLLTLFYPVLFGPTLSTSRSNGQHDLRRATNHPQARPATLFPPPRRREKYHEPVPDPTFQWLRHRSPSSEP